MRAGDQTPGKRLDPGNRPIKAGIDFGRRDRIGDPAVGHFHGFAERMARIHGGDIGVGDFRAALELAGQPVERRFAVAVVEPIDQAQRPHVLAAKRFLLAEALILDGFQGVFGNIDGDNPVVGEAVVFERVLVEAGLFQVPVGERAGIRDDQAAIPQIAEVDLQRRRVQRNQHVRRIAGGLDVAGSEMNLKGRNAEGRAGGRPDLGRKVREGCQVVSGQRGGLGELPPRNLNAVARVPGEADDNVLHFLAGRFFQGNCGGAYHCRVLPTILLPKRSRGPRRPCKKISKAGMSIGVDFPGDQTRSFHQKTAKKRAVLTQWTPPANHRIRENRSIFREPRKRSFRPVI